MPDEILTVLEYLILISIKLALFSILSLVLVSRHLQTSQRSSEKLRFGRIYSFLLGVWTSGLSCFIHYVTCYFVFSKFTTNSVSPG